MTNPAGLPNLFCSSFPRPYYVYLFPASSLNSDLLFLHFPHHLFRAREIDTTPVSLANVLCVCDGEACCNLLTTGFNARPLSCQPSDLLLTLVGQRLSLSLPEPLTYIMADLTQSSSCTLSVLRSIMILSRSNALEYMAKKVRKARQSA